MLTGIQPTTTPQAGGAAHAAAGGPLRIDELALPAGGTLGMCHFPGRCGIDGAGRAWSRSVDDDLHAIHLWGASAVLSLVESHEFARLGVPDLGARILKSGMAWLHHPVADMGVPTTRLFGASTDVGQDVLNRLRAGERVVVHCAAGLGRTGTMAAALLVACGVEPDSAIAQVRHARPGTLETAGQEAYVRGLRTVQDPLSPPAPPR